MVITLSCIDLYCCRCGHGYFLDTHDQEQEVAPGVKLRDLNSQVAEQRNNMLDRIRTQVAYARHCNAYDYTKYFLASINQGILASLK